MLRILDLKLRLYGGCFPQGGVVPGDVIDISGGSELAFCVASQAASFISPSSPENLGCRPAPASGLSSSPMSDS